MHLDIYQSVWFKLGMLIDNSYTLHLDTSLIDHDLDSRSQECEKAQTSAPIISQSFMLIGMEFGIVLRLVSVTNLILFNFVHVIFKGTILRWLH